MRCGKYSRTASLLVFPTTWGKTLTSGKTSEWNLNNVHDFFLLDKDNHFVYSFEIKKTESQNTCDLTNRNSDITGYRFAKGPIDLKNTWFGGFNSTSERTATAIGNDVCMNHCHPRNSLYDIMFDFNDVSFYSIVLYSNVS